MSLADQSPEERARIREAMLTEAGLAEQTGFESWRAAGPRRHKPGSTSDLRISRRNQRMVPKATDPER